MTELMSLVPVEQVVVASDSSPGAQRAVSWAAERARLWGCQLRIVRITPQDPLPTRQNVFKAMAEGPAYARRVWARAQQHLDEDLASAQQAFPDLEITADLIKSDRAAEVLAQLADDAHLLVLGATGTSAVNRTLLGGTVAAVVHHAHGPVVVVPSDLGRPGGPVVVGLDDGPHTGRIAATAVRAAKAAGVDLVAVRCWALPDPYLPTAESEKVSADLAQQLRSLLEPSGLAVTPVVDQRSPADVLVEQSARASLVIMGSRGQGGFPGLLLGSVSRSVILRSHCPVLVVRT